MRNDAIRTLAARGAILALLAFLMCGCGGENDESAAIADPPGTGGIPPQPVPPALPSVGAATVEWLAPQTSTDGSPLANLAGYRIYYGTDVTRMTRKIEVTNAGVLSYVIEGLAPATYYFAVTAVNIHGGESTRSNAGRKIIS